MGATPYFDPKPTEGSRRFFATSQPKIVPIFSFCKVTGSWKCPLSNGNAP